jgi:hypothetical protein
MSGEQYRIISLVDEVTNGMSKEAELDLYGDLIADLRMRKEGLEEELEDQQ